MAANLWVLDQKTPQTSAVVMFDFISQLPPGSTTALEGGSVSAFVWTGADPNPQAIVVGTPTVGGTKLFQWLGGGVAGTIYKLRILALTLDGQQLAMTSYLAVVEDPV